MRKKVLVLGGNFGGLTAALSVQYDLHGDVDVVVVSVSDRFLFNPSLIWLITTLEDAVHAGAGWRRFLDAPGQMVEVPQRIRQAAPTPPSRLHRPVSTRSSASRVAGLGRGGDRAGGGPARGPTAHAACGGCDPVVTITALG